MRASRIALLGAVLLATVPVAACSSPAGPEATPPASAPASRSGSAAPSSADSADWPMYHGTPDHAGYSPGMPPAGPLELLHDLKLDGAVYASPLVVGGRTIVATENDSVYAFDASYRQVWRQRLGTPSPAGERQCGNIDPLGITGTPIYDAGTGHILVVAELGGQVRHTLFALDPATGAVAWQKSVDLPGAAARDMQQRGALAIAHGRVWVTFGGQAGDCGDYKGRVAGVRLDGTGTPIAYTVPTGRGGGIWHPDGPVVNPAGNLLVVAGNGSAMSGAAYDHTNAVLELDGDGRMIDSFSPADWASRNEGDVDLGSQGVALVEGKWAVLGDKAGSVWVLRLGALGGIGGQVSMLDTCRSFGGAAVRGDVVYLPCVDGVRALRVDSAGKLRVLWHADRSVTASPVIGGGRVWSLDSDGGVLHALDPGTGRSTGEVRVGQTNRFATPALSGDTVIVPTLSGIAVVRA
jgi:outer membrane protein assembly factor BamB